MSEGTSRPHAISLNVLRLSAPSFSKRYPLVIENSCLFSESIHGLQQLDPGISNEDSQFSLTRSSFALSDLVELPTSFGNVYLGQFFRCLIVIKNEMKSSLKHVTCKSELYPNIDQSSPIKSGPDADTKGQEPSSTEDLGLTGVFMQSAEVKSWKVVYEIKKVGVHTLSCQIGYTTMRDEQRSVKKLFKFNVINPMTVRTRILERGDQTLTYLEAQLTNISSEPLYVDRVGLQVPAGQRALMLGQQSHFLVKPEEITQVLFVVSYDEIFEGKDSESLGQLDLHWKTISGNPGHLQTSNLQRKKLQIKGDMEIYVRHADIWLDLNTRTNIGLLIKNVALDEHRWKLKISEKDDRNIIALLGVLDRELPTLLPGASCVLSIEVLALRPGATGHLRLWSTDIDSLQAMTHDIILDLYAHDAIP
jgi:trafficking protein particle complex subunit 13